MQLASSQFSPRLLRTFERDWGNQVVLGVFLATFAFSLTVLPATGARGVNDVPRLAVSGAFVMALASVAALVYFIHHAVEEIRVDTMMRDVERETRDTIERIYPPLATGDLPRAELPPVPLAARALAARETGFIQDLATDDLAAAATARDLVVRLHAAAGDVLIESGPTAWVWRPDGSAPSDEDLAYIQPDVEAAMQLGHERTQQGDVAFGLRQLTDVAVKALSPAINDPTTAEHALDRLTSLLCLLARRRIEPLVATDAQGTLRVAVPFVSFEGYLDLACGQIRRYGAGEPVIARALLGLLRVVAGVVTGDDNREALRRQADMVLAASEHQTFDPRDLDDVRAGATAVQRALDGDLRP